MFGPLLYGHIGALSSRRGHALTAASINNCIDSFAVRRVANHSHIMTDRPEPLSSQLPIPSQTVPLLPPGPVATEEVTQKVETVEEEPYTIKCICNFTDDDGNTIYCDTCDTWQHIECFYPNNREEAIREDFSHSCADCKPRPLNRQKAIQRTSQLNHDPPGENGDKKTKRPPSKSHKKKAKPSESLVNGVADLGKQIGQNDTNPLKKPKVSHRHSQSVGSLHPKRSPSVSQSRSHLAHPPSPANSPPDLPDDFTIHHYSDGFYALYNDRDVANTENNQFASLAIPTALSRWLREPEKMKEEVGRTHSDVFQEPSATAAASTNKPKLEVQDATRALDSGTVLRWRFLMSMTPVEKDVQLLELNGEIGFQAGYCADADNLWGDLSSPLPFVFFHPVLPLYIDTRKEGSLARYVRRSCRPNAQLDTYLSDGSEYHFWLMSDRHIGANEQVTLPWDFRLDKSVRSRWLHLLGLNDDETPTQDEPDMNDAEYIAISNWIDRILSEYGGCACDLENNCAFARFHRHYLHGKGQTRSNGGRKKQRKSRTHTISPTSTGHPSRAASEGHVDDGQDFEIKSQSGSNRSKPSSRDPTPTARQGSFDQLGILTEPTDREKRKVQMVEESFRRMEQQQPPRKKKRVSDGTTNPKSKQRTGSTSQGQYVDAATGRSKTGSPSSAQSPTFPNIPKAVSRRHSIAQRSRQSSGNPGPVYVDSASQTDPVEGEWFSCPLTPAKPQRRVISLAQRLLNSRSRVRVEDRQRRQPLTPRTSTGSAIEIDSPTAYKAPIDDDDHDAKSPLTSQGADVAMSDAPADTSPTANDSSTGAEAKKETPDLRVLLPPVPAFDNQVPDISASTTPASATSTMPQSPFSAPSLPTPLNGPSSINGPSPAKKKLSLSDYTRRSKAAGKVVGGSAVMKPTLLSPEESKVDIVMEESVAEKTGEVPNVSVNGHS